MINLISKEAVDKSGFSFDNAQSYASATGLIGLGMLVAHNGTRLVNKSNSIPVNALVSAAGFAGAMFIPNGWAKFVALGVGAFAGIKTIGLLTAVATAPGPVAGLGFIPDPVKAAIRQFIPTLGAVDVPFEGVDGDGSELMGNLDDPIQGLDDQPLLGEFGSTNQVEGLGQAGLML